MSMRSFETQILHEAREVVGKRSLRLKDILEWSTSESKVKEGVRPGEVAHHLPECGVWIAVAGPAK